MVDAIDMLMPDWPAPPNVRALLTTRGASGADGDSAAPYEFFNLGDHVGDEPLAVAGNRQRLQRAMDARPVFMNQVHGIGVLCLQRGTPDGVTADAAVCNQPGLACTVMVADCLPVLITDTQGRAVAGAHAGWRGLAGGVLEQTLAAFQAMVKISPMQAATGSQPIELMAWLGPCIGPRAFEVGPEVREAFIAADAGAGDCFVAQPAGKYLADLPALARRRLAALGVTKVHGNDGGADWCTVQQPERYFSYRRDQHARGGTGRMAACIWLA
ncbi:MAG: peptidoglycan editing factor PgeF [Pseudomonadota bacterium]|nr:peptidoglycan editing factor PgeF [Pseudomonadota bacterium]